MIDWFYLEKLAAISSHKPDRERLMYLESNWDEFAELEYLEIVTKMHDNLIDPITSGNNYGQKDIMRHLNKLK